jgi:hypothetical protein
MTICRTRVDPSHEYPAIHHSIGWNWCEMRRPICCSQQRAV